MTITSSPIDTERRFRRPDNATNSASTPPRLTTFTKQPFDENEIISYRISCFCVTLSTTNTYHMIPGSGILLNISSPTRIGVGIFLLTSASLILASLPYFELMMEVDDK